MHKYVKIDLFFIALFIGYAIVVCSFKYFNSYENWYTGLVMLGLLPVVIYDLKRDYRLGEKTK